MTTTSVDRPLSKAERSEFKKLDNAVRTGAVAFVVVGLALREIHARKLYREQYDTFEEYVRDVHDLTRMRAHQLIEAAITMHLLEAADVNHGLQNGDRLLPQNERQVRPLTKLPPDERATVWEAVVERHTETGEPITAAVVAAVVASDSPAGKTGGRVSEDDLDRRLQHLHKTFASLPTRRLKESFVERLQNLLVEMEQWLEQ